MLHKKVQIVLANEDQGTITLFQVNEKRGSFWQNMTGSVDGAESLEQAAKRELYEESGISDAKLLPLKLIHHFHDGWDRDVEEHCFIALSTQRPTLSEEHQAFKELAIEDVCSDHFKFETNYKTFLEAKKMIHCEKN